jgi:nonribosomal peptide synthetase DhbF
MMWYLDRASPDTAAYNVPLAWRLTGTVNIEALRRTLAQLAERHPQLRTAFPMVAGVPQAVTFCVSDVPLDVRRLDAESAVDASVLHEVRRPFDLESAPLFRALLLQHVGGASTLVLTFHHIVCDGHSLPIVHHDLLAVYAAECTGTTARLEPPATDYATYAQIEREAEASDAFDEGLEWWTEQLCDLPRFQLAGDRRPSRTPSGRGARVSRLLGTQRTSRLRAIARARRTTLFATLLASYAVFLARYSREREIVVGLPLAGRRRPELQSVVGNFTEMVTLRLDMDVERPFTEHMATAQDALLDALTFGDVPLQRVVERIAPLRSNPDDGLFTVAIVEQTHLPDGNAGGVEFSNIPVETGTAKFDLLLEITDRGDDVLLTFEYASDRFDDATAAALMDVFHVSIAHALERIDVAVANLALEVGDGRRDTPIVQAVDAASFVHRRFRDHAVTAPAAIALQHGDRQVTYAELARCADAIRASLSACGVRPGDMVGLCAERSPELVAAIVAILDAGAVYVPLDPQSPSDRLRYIIEDSGASVIVAHEALSGVAPDGTRVIALEQAVRLPPTPLPPVAAGTGDAAYIIYTSGSTGRPKGVIVEHGNVARLFTVTEPVFAFSAHDRWTLFHSYAFDFSVWELWGSLAYGGRLVIVPADVAGDARAFVRLVAQAGITVLNQTPSAFYEFDAAERAQPVDLRLRHVILGGEAVEPRRLAGWFQRHGENAPRVSNMYGITETTVHVTYRELHATDSDAAYSPIGIPLGDLCIELRDEQGRTVPPGFVGEIHVSGAGVARGYCNDAALTAHRFARVCQGGNPIRTYRTGDLARRRHDGSFEYVGRLDEQVKVRGFRVEPGEIEAVLSGHPSVERAIVLPERLDGDVRLTAYVALREDKSLGELRDYIGSRLPAYMVPARFARVDAIPQTRNGKVDRKALAASARPIEAQPHEPNLVVSALEGYICDIAQQLLRVPNVSVNDNFFTLGGHSLLAARFLARVEDAVVGPALGSRAGTRSGLLRAFYREPTVRALAATLDHMPLVHGNVVAIQDGEPNRTPIFWFHGAYRENGLYTRGIVASMPPDVPFYIVIPHGQEGEPFPADIATLAAERLAEIRAIRPHGPYIFGGWCNGALVAFEAATRARSSGDRVEQLVMLSPTPLVALAPALSRITDYAGRFAQLDDRTRMKLLLRLRSFSNRAERLLSSQPEVRAALARNIRRRFVEKKDVFEGPGAVGMAAEIELRYLIALTSYRPKLYDGLVHIVHGTGERTWLPTPDAGWGRYFSQYDVIELGGPLLSAPAMSELGRLLSDLLEQRAS